MEGLRGARILVFAVTITLIAIGVVMIYSSSAVYAYDKFGDNMYFIRRHLLSLAVGVTLAMVFMRVDLDRLRRHSRKLLALTLLLLVLVLIPGIGVAVGGARRWLRIGAMSLQPVEAAKPFFLLYLADFLDRKQLESDSLLKVYIPALLMICAISALVVLQPDLGSSIEIAVIGIIVLFVYGARLKHIFFTLAAGLPFLGMMIIGSTYRFARIMAYLDPWKDPRGTGFQMIQSFTALGSGGVLGVGLGNSKQKLFYLPESHTDFIFSILGEELGFMGAGAIVILFIILLWNGMRITLKKASEFSRLLAFSITALIGLEAIINIGVSTGALPTKGLPLPFLSYGGSSLVVHMILIGMLLNLGKDDEP